MPNVDEWDATRRELAQLAWAVGLIDGIAIGLGALAALHVGPFARTIGLLLAAFVTVVFVLIVLGNLAVVWVADRVSKRRRL